MVENVKLLGFNISSNLTWNVHIKEIVKKASKRLYFLIQLKRAKVDVPYLIIITERASGKVVELMKEYLWPRSRSCKEASNYRIMNERPPDECFCR